jgi:hypothetical protein
MSREEWVISESGESCSAACSSYDYTCDDSGDNWGINDVNTYNDALKEADQQLLPLHVTNLTPLSDDSPPVYSNRSTGSEYNIAGNNVDCSKTASNKNLLCKCNATEIDIGQPCVTLTESPGYEWSSEQGNDIGIEIDCASGYYPSDLSALGKGTIICDGSTSPRNFKGCTPMKVCIKPDSIPDSVSIASLNPSSFDGTVTCPDNFHLVGNPNISQCERPRNLDEARVGTEINFDRFSCDPDTCNHPQDVIGYNIVDVDNQDLTIHSFSVTAECDIDNGYSAQFTGVGGDNIDIGASQAVCSEHGQSYTLGGCEIRTCTEHSDEEKYLFDTGDNIWRLKGDGSSVSRTIITDDSSFKKPIGCTFKNHRTGTGTLSSTVCVNPQTDYTLEGCEPTTCGVTSSSPSSFDTTGIPTTLEFDGNTNLDCSPEQPLTAINSGERYLVNIYNPSQRRTSSSSATDAFIKIDDISYQISIPENLPSENREIRFDIAKALIEDDNIVGSEINICQGNTAPSDSDICFIYDLTIVPNYICNHEDPIDGGNGALSSGPTHDVVPSFHGCEPVLTGTIFPENTCATIVNDEEFAIVGETCSGHTENISGLISGETDVENVGQSDRYILNYDASNINSKNINTKTIEEICCKNTTCSSYRCPDTHTRRIQNLNLFKYDGIYGPLEICCESKTCGEWQTENTCSAERPNPEGNNKLGFSEEECCQEICDGWYTRTEKENLQTRFSIVDTLLRDIYIQYNSINDGQCHNVEIEEVCSAIDSENTEHVSICNSIVLGELNSETRCTSAFDPTNTDTAPPAICNYQTECPKTIDNYILPRVIHNSGSDSGTPENIDPCLDETLIENKYGNGFNECCATSICSDKTWDCPENTSENVDNLLAKCDGFTCEENDNNISVCCSENQTCEDMTCSSNYSKKTNTLDRICPGVLCNDEECCFENETCADISCKNGYSLNSSTLTTNCTSPECSIIEDHDNCCISNETCSTMVCPNNHFVDQVNSQKTCYEKTCNRENDYDLLLCCDECGPVENAVGVSCTNKIDSIATSCIDNYVVNDGVCEKKKEIVDIQLKLDGDYTEFMNDVENIQRLKESICNDLISNTESPLTLETCMSKLLIKDITEGSLIVEFTIENEFDTGQPITKENIEKTFLVGNQISDLGMTVIDEPIIVSEVTENDTKCVSEGYEHECSFGLKLVDGAENVIGITDNECCTMDWKYLKYIVPGLLLFLALVYISF